MALLCCSRLGSGSVLSTLTKCPMTLRISNYAQTSELPKIVYKKYEKSEVEQHDVKNCRLNRPMSPFTIYAIQMNSTMSISHRITGIALSGYITVLGIGGLVSPYDISHCITIIEGLNLSPATLLLVKAMIAAPFSYHFANGIRHLYWDTGKGLTMKEVFKSGYTVLGVTTLITLTLASL